MLLSDIGHHSLSTSQFMVYRVSHLNQLESNDLYIAYGSIKCCLVDMVTMVVLNAAVWILVTMVHHQEVESLLITVC